MPKPAFLGLRTVIYPVDDLAKAKAWYAKVLTRVASSRRAA